MWSNFHTHSNYCDGKSSLAEVVSAAVSKSMISLGLSSHAPLPFPSNWCMKKERLEHYLLEIAQLKKSTSQVQLYCGLEVDYIPEKISPADFINKLDYSIGSVHFVESFSDGAGWEIDGTHQFFKQGFEHIYKKDIRAVINRYYELTREMITKSCPTIIGHLDKIKIQNFYHPYFDESENWYRDEVRRTINDIRIAGAIIEVNTRGIYQKKSLTTYPSPWILELIRDLKIPVTISSDAHHADDLINQFPETAKLLTEIGFKKIRILFDGKWQDRPLHNYQL